MNMDAFKKQFDHKYYSAKTHLPNDKELAWEHFTNIGWKSKQFEAFNYNLEPFYSYLYRRIAKDTNSFEELYDEYQSYKQKMKLLKANFDKKKYRLMLKLPNEVDAWGHFYNTNRFRISGLCLEYDNCFTTRSLIPNRFPRIFHKYMLNLSSPSDKIRHCCMFQKNIELASSKKLWAHLHSYSIEEFKHIYSEHMPLITKYYGIVITYSIGTIDFSNIYSCDNTPIIVLKIQNKGMDIGAKFNAVTYLKNHDIEFEFILMLHSKSNVEKRMTYFNPILQNLENTTKQLNNQHGVYTIPIIRAMKTKDRRDSQKVANWAPRSQYIQEIIDYFNLPSFNYIFPEGNIYILHHDIANAMYNEKNLLYNCLNNCNSFDYAWVKTYYNLNGNIYDVYRTYLINNLYGNNLQCVLNNEEILLPDYMIEHIFERIVFGFAKKLKKRVKILSLGYNRNDKINRMIQNKTV